MKPRIEKRALAKLDLAEQADYIRRDSPQAAIRFLESAEKAFSDLATQPGLGIPEVCDSPRLADLRCWPIPGFRKHLIFYFQRPDGIEIIRVLHGSRDIQAILNR